MLARVPWTPTVAGYGSRRHRLSVGRRRQIEKTVCELLRRGDPTPFAFEAPCRHGLRRALCLAGWRWGRADAMADEIVSTCLRAVGAKRPSWNEGQPDWTRQGAFPIERDRCRHCARPMPSERWIYCSDECQRAVAYLRFEERKRSERMAGSLTAEAVRGG